MAAPRHAAARVPAHPRAARPGPLRALSTGGSALRRLANAFLVAYAGDALLSALDDSLRHAAGITFLDPLRQALAFAVLLGSLAVYLAAGLAPQLPKRILLPPALFVLWWSLGAVPLGLLAPGFEHRALLASALQLSLGALAFALVRRRYGSWLFGSDSLPPPTWRLRYTLVFLALHLALALPVAATWAGLSLAGELVRSSGGFVAFGGEGMQVVERRYRAGDREVVLVGMVHIGEPSLYRSLYASFVEGETVVLQEGVTDLGDRLGVPISYEPIAEAAGLEMQPSLESLMPELRIERTDGAGPWPHLRHADVDASRFSPGTVEFLQRLARLIGAPDPARELRAFGSFARAAGPELWRELETDLLVLRNRHVVGELDRALETYARVVIPWGALHMPGIEERVRARGFERVRERRHLALRYATLARGGWQLLRTLSRPASP